VVSRFLGQEVPMRYTTYEKPGLFQRIFRGK
jgi:septum site-determining protein MinD